MDLPVSFFGISRFFCFCFWQALQAIASYAQLADASYVGSIFKSLVAKWLKATTGEADGSDGAAAALCFCFSSGVKELGT